MQNDLRSVPWVRHLVRSREVQAFLDSQDIGSINRTMFLNQLDIVDNAACSWLELIRGINVNVFRGFANEAELVNYVLHNAYHDQVTVLASKLIYINISFHFV